MNQITKDVVIEMLRENTGMNFLDSGGTPKYDANGCYIGSTHGYGRAFERNRCINFDNQPELSWKFDSWSSRWELMATRSVYHLLVNNFDYAEDWQQIFDDFCEQPDNLDLPWLQCMYKFGEWLDTIYDDVGFGPYGEGTSPNDGVYNTYNGESNLSQTLQFMEITIPEENENIVLIQVHGGCDLRGGYSAPRAFRENGRCELPLWDTARLYVQCNKCDNHQWCSDNAGYSLYWQGWDDKFVETDQPMLPELLSDEDKTKLTKARMGEIKDLNKYILYDPEYGAVGVDSDGDFVYAPEDEDWDENPSWRKGYVFVDEDGNGYCPICGGVLEVY
jgi:hypothetical protein